MRQNVQAATCDSLERQMTFHSTDLLANCLTSTYLTRILNISPIAIDELFTPFFNDLTQEAIRVIPGPVPQLALIGQCIID